MTRRNLGLSAASWSRARATEPRPPRAGAAPGSPHHGRRVFVAIAALALVLPIRVATVGPPAVVSAASAANTTTGVPQTLSEAWAENSSLSVTTDPTQAQTSSLRTWWHDDAEPNALTPVADDHVRQSTFYTTRVASDSAHDAWYDSFTYLTIPRSGKGKPGYGEATGPGNFSEDGAENVWEDAEEIGATQGIDNAHHTMSWTTFQYAADTWVDVELATGQTVASIDEVQIKPRQLGFQRYLVDDRTVRIKVPYAESGYRFSVEFAPQLTVVAGANKDYWEFLAGAPDPSVGHMMEPRNAMLVFAEPMTGTESGLVPTDNDGEIYRPEPGAIRDLDGIDADILYFEPGTYYMGSDHRTRLPARVNWIYLAPGAYVKGAFEFLDTTQNVDYKVTGYGVLSGEQYVYEADTRNPELSRRNPSEYADCHSSCVKPLRFDSAFGFQQHLDLQGVTIVEPPYHSFVVYGEESSFSMTVRNYHQVGAWYWQTDGLELYANSTMKDTFLHANDDVLKVYHSNVSIEETVVWKGPNGPVVQWGWVPRNIENVSIKRTYVIHNQMQWETINTCVVNSSRHWSFDGRTDRASRGASISNILIEDTYVEGPTNCMIRLYALSNTSNVKIKGMHIDGWVVKGPQLSNRIEADTEGADGPAVDIDVRLEDYSVGGAYVWRNSSNGSQGNWHDDGPGRLFVPGELWANWDVKMTPSAPINPFPLGSPGGIADPCTISSANVFGLGCPTDPEPCGSTDCEEPCEGPNCEPGCSDPDCEEPCEDANCGEGPGGSEPGGPQPGGPGQGVTPPATVTLRATARPRVTGTARVGGQLRSTAGAWSEKSVSVRYQWLRSGKPIRGATRATYRLQRADVSKRVSVRVTASKTGFSAGINSSTTRLVRKAQTRVTVSRKAVRSGTQRAIRIRVATAATTRPTGRITVYIGGSKVTVKVRARDRGRITVRVPRAVAGTKRVRVTAQFKPAKNLARSTTSAKAKPIRVA